MLDDMNWGEVEWLWLATRILVLLVCVSVHESAHAWAADRLGDRTARSLGRVSLNPLVHIDWVGSILFPLLTLLSGVGVVLGWAKPVPVNPHNLPGRFGHALVAAAGPAGNLLLAAGCWAALRASLAFGLGGLAEIWYFGLILNVVLAAFNLFPIPPLDGSWILRSVLPKPFSALFDGIQPYGVALLFLLLYLGVFSTVLTPILAFVRRFAV